LRNPRLERVAANLDPSEPLEGSAHHAGKEADDIGALNNGRFHSGPEKGSPETDFDG